MKNWLRGCQPLVGIIGLIALSLSASRAAAQSGLQVLAAPPPAYIFGQDITFQISARSDTPIASVTLFFRAPDEALTSVGEAQFTPGQVVTATYTLKADAHTLTPFSTMDYWWEIRDRANHRLATETAAFHYTDNRFTWQTLTRAPVTVYWHTGDTTFGQMAADIATQALTRANQDFQASLPQTISVYIYPALTEMEAALRGTERIWIEGHANPTLGVIVVAAAPGLDAETHLSRDLPHELIHILVYRAAGNRPGSVPPWLDEGLAVMYQPHPDPNLPTILEKARAGGALLPLSQLCAPFPADPAQAQLAYAQSASMVQYIRDQHGFAALRSLLAAYADGASCDGGVQRGLGISLQQLESSWLQAMNTSPVWFQLQAIFPWLILAALVIFSGGLLAWLVLRTPDSRARVV